MPDFSEIGILSYYYELPKAGGKLRIRPEDFIVEEVIDSLVPNDNGKFLILKVMAKNWEHNRLVKYLARSMGVSPKRIGFAGTKDRRALKIQYFSIYGVKYKEIRLEDFSILDHFYSESGIYLGNHRSNRFMIKISDTDLKILERNFHIVNKSSIFPNYYGPQRFGNMRPVSHLVGRDIVMRNYREAVLKFIGYPGEDNFTEIRSEFYDNPDPAKFAERFPDALDLEKAVLFHLKDKPDDYMGAIKRLPPNLVNMFIHAYQAYLFNKMVSERIKISKEVEIGDLVNYGGKLIKVNSLNLSEIREKYSKMEVWPTALVIGYEQEYSGGIQGEIERNILEGEQVSFVDFKMPFDMSSKGERRNIFEFAQHLKLSDDTISFELSPGSYATSLIRELIREEDMMKY